MKYKTPILLFVLTIVFAIVVMTVFRKNEFSDLDTREKCEEPERVAHACNGDKDCCAIWNDGFCLRGKSNGIECKEVRKPIATIFAVLLLGTFAAFVITLLMTVFGKKEHRYSKHSTESPQ